MNTYKTEGVVLKRINFGDSDKIVSLYTKDYGKVSCLAKGIRKLSSRKKGSLEIFSQIKFFAVRGRGIDIITEVELVDSFFSWRKNLRKIASAYQVCEMVDKLTAENHEQENIYDLVVLFLKNLEEVDEGDLSFKVNEFSLDLLKLLGFWPENKPFPGDLNIFTFIENIIERELKSKNFVEALQSN